MNCQLCLREIKKQKEDHICGPVFVKYPYADQYPIAYQRQMEKMFGRLDNHISLPYEGGELKK